MSEKIENIKTALAYEIYEKFKHKTYAIETEYSEDNITELKIDLLLVNNKISIPNQLLLRF